MAYPVNHFGACINPDCFKRVCTFFKAKEFSVDELVVHDGAPQHLECAFCLCYQHEHLLLGISIHETFLDTTSMKPRVLVRAWERRFDVGVSTDDSVRNVPSANTHDALHTR